MASSDASSGSPFGGLAGFFLGAFFGSAFGIAGFGIAIAGTLPVGILGAWLGYRHGARVMAALESVNDGNSSHLKEDLRRVLERGLDVLFPHSTNRISDGTHNHRTNDIVIHLLTFQLGLAGFEQGVIRFSNSTFNDWSIGYV